MTLGEVLDGHEPAVDALVKRSKAQVAAAQNLLKAVRLGNLRDMDKLLSAARQRVDDSEAALDDVAPIDFDLSTYLGAGGAFLTELQAAADDAGVRMFIRDDKIYCYPVLIKMQPDSGTISIDKKKVPTVRPAKLAADLKKLQDKGSLQNNAQFLKNLARAYPYVAARRNTPAGTDVPLVDIYEVIALLPDVRKEYPLQDFTRDVYLLDTSGIEVIDRQRVSLSASTATRESRSKVLSFVDRDGHEKHYSMIRFVSAADGENSGAAQ